MAKAAGGARAGGTTIAAETQSRPGRWLMMSEPKTSSKGRGGYSYQPPPDSLKPLAYCRVEESLDPGPAKESDPAWDRRAPPPTLEKGGEEEEKG